MYKTIVNKCYILVISELEKVIKLKEDQEDQNLLEDSLDQGRWQMTFNPTQQSADELIDRSPQKIYGNPIILENIVDNFQLCLQKIAFKRILAYMSNYDYYEFFETIFAVLSPYEAEAKKEGLVKICEQANFVYDVIEQLNYQKMKRVFKAWKLIKRRKIKLLKKIVGKKRKVDQFLMSIALMRWKVESRTARIQKMTSQVSLRLPANPKSKKAVDVAYKRVMSRRKLK